MSNTKRLVELAQKGDNQAFIKLLQDYEKVLYNTARKWIYNEEDVADISKLLCFEIRKHIF